MTVRAGTQVERLFVSSVSPSFFSTLGIKPMLGRLPTAEDDDGDVVVIGHWLWTTWFGRDPSLLGRPLDVGGGFRIVVGVMGAEYATSLSGVRSAQAMSLSFACKWPKPWSSRRREAQEECSWPGLGCLYSCARLQVSRKVADAQKLCRIPIRVNRSK
jgi:MacB-like protein